MTNKIANVKPLTSSIGISCIICGEVVELTSYEEEAIKYGKCIHSKVCLECKKAVLKMRGKEV